MSYEVLAHERHEDAGVYRVVVGVPIRHETTEHVQVGERRPSGAMQLVDDVRAYARELEKDADAAAKHDDDDVRAAADGIAAAAERAHARADELEAAIEPEPVYEERSDVAVLGHEAVEDFVFAADDERWQGKTPSQIAEEQRRLVADALKQRASESEPQGEVQALPIGRL
jgi:hypothetical protein